jgi:hypothetical protein
MAGVRRIRRKPQEAHLSAYRVLAPATRARLKRAPRGEHQHQRSGDIMIRQSQHNFELQHNFDMAMLMADVLNFLLDPHPANYEPRRQEAIRNLNWCQRICLKGSNDDLEEAS